MERGLDDPRMSIKRPSVYVSTRHGLDARLDESSKEPLRYRGTAIALSHNAMCISGDLRAVPWWTARHSRATRYYALLDIADQAQPLSRRAQVRGRDI